MTIKSISKFAFILIGVSVLVAFGTKSSKVTSRATGWSYNEKAGMQFTVKPGFVSKIPDGMVAIEGGSYTIGEKGEFVTAQRDNRRRRITEIGRASCRERV